MSVSEAWRERFIEAWNVREIHYAEALDRGQPLPTADDWDGAGTSSVTDVCCSCSVGRPRPPSREAASLSA